MQTYNYNMYGHYLPTYIFDVSSIFIGCRYQKVNILSKPVINVSLQDFSKTVITPTRTDTIFLIPKNTTAKFEIWFSYIAGYSMEINNNNNSNFTPGKESYIVNK